MPHQELKIVDPATGQDRAARRAGEICFRGYQVMAGYDNMPDGHGGGHRRARLAALGRHRDDGRRGLREITGRIKNMIIRGGENIYPREIEEFLHTLDYRSSTRRSSASRTSGSARSSWPVSACTAPPPRTRRHPTEFRELCKGKIAHFKIPRYWKVLDKYPHDRSPARCRSSSCGSRWRAAPCTSCRPAPPLPSPASWPAP